MTSGVLPPFPEIDEGIFKAYALWLTEVYDLKT